MNIGGEDLYWIMNQHEKWRVLRPGQVRLPLYQYENAFHSHLIVNQFNYMLALISVLGVNVLVLLGKLMSVLQCCLG